jgi:hypothetical protein
VSENKYSYPPFKHGSCFSKRGLETCFQRSAIAQVTKALATSWKISARLPSGSATLSSNPVSIRAVCLTKLHDLEGLLGFRCRESDEGS